MKHNLLLLGSKPPFVLKYFQNTTGALAFILTDSRILDVCLTRLSIRLNNVLMFVPLKLGMCVLMGLLANTVTQLLRNFTILKSTKTYFVSHIQIASALSFVLSTTLMRSKRKQIRKFRITIKRE